MWKGSLCSTRQSHTNKVGFIKTSLPAVLVSWALLVWAMMEMQFYLSMTLPSANLHPLRVSSLTNHNMNKKRQNHLLPNGSIASQARKNKHRQSHHNSIKCSTTLCNWSLNLSSINSIVTNPPEIKATKRQMICSMITCNWYRQPTLH